MWMSAGRMQLVLFVVLQVAVVVVESQPVSLDAHGEWAGELEFAEHTFDDATLSEVNDLPIQQTESSDRNQASRSLEECGSFDEDPRDPGNTVSRLSEPWTVQNRKMCKLVVTWRDGSSAECSGSLVGPFHLITAAHCTLNACKGGFAQEVLVKCGYGYSAGASDFAQLGTAVVKQCVHYRSFAAQQSCDEGASVGPSEWDIQLCRLDRNLKHSHRYWGTTFLTRNTVTVRGYPIADALNTFIPHATESLLTRTTPASLVNSRQYELPEAWTFSGEAGGPYLWRSASNKAFSVTGVHVSGGAGCPAIGRKIDQPFGQLLQNRLSTWKTTNKWCNIIEDRVNLGDTMAPLVKGISVKRNPSVWSSSVAAQHGSYFNSKVQLLNVGSQKSPEFRISFHLSNLNRTETIYLGSRRLSIRKWSSKLIRKYYLSTSRTTPGDFYRVYATWKTACLKAKDPTRADIGILRIT